MNWLRPKDVKGKTALDIILKAFLKNDLESLSEDHKFILERITEVDRLIRSGRSVIKSKMDDNLGVEVEDYRFNRPYRKRELAEWQVARFGVSLAQGFIDVEWAERFFVSTETRSDKEFAKGMMIYWGEEVASEARANGDYRAFAAIFKELSKIKGLDKPDEPNFDPEKFQPVQPIIVADPSDLGFEKVENPDKLVAKLQKELRKNKLMERLISKEATDAEIVEEADDE